MSNQDDHFIELQEILQTVDNYFDPNTANIVLEIGSRDAIESINMKKHFKNAKIYAFECNPEAIKICEKNLLNVDEIHLEKYAVSDFNGPLSFYAIDPEKTITSHKDGNIGASSLFKPNPDYPYENYSVNEIKVESVTINKWANTKNIDKIDFIWVDVQGAELKVLSGMSDYLKNVNSIYIEVEFKPIWIGQSLYVDIYEFLSKHGFKIVKVYGLNDWFGNILFVNYQKLNFIKKIKASICSIFFKNYLKLRSVVNSLWRS